MGAHTATTAPIGQIKVTFFNQRFKTLKKLIEK